MNHIKGFKSFEGKTFQGVKKMHSKKPWDPDNKTEFRKSIKNLVKSQGHKTNQVGNDIEILLNDKVVVQVLFRNDYVGIRKLGEKFVDEFKYTELGKIKQKISSIIKDETSSK